jgi:hypothetical protein
MHPTVEERLPQAPERAAVVRSSEELAACGNEPSTPVNLSATLGRNLELIATPFWRVVPRVLSRLGSYMTIEESLSRAVQYSALLRYLAEVAVEPHEVPSRAVLAGLADVCEQIENFVRSARCSLPSSALRTEIR